LLQLAALAKGKAAPEVSNSQLAPYEKPAAKKRLKKRGQKKGHKGVRRAPLEIDREEEHVLDCKRLRKRLVKFRDSLVTFLDDAAVPFDNNRAEPEIRPAVIARKNSFHNTSEEGADTQAMLMSIYRTLVPRSSCAGWTRSRPSPTRWAFSSGPASCRAFPPPSPPVDLGRRSHPVFSNAISIARVKKRLAWCVERFFLDTGRDLCHFSIIVARGG
jgi:hypothetical protein